MHTPRQGVVEALVAIVLMQLINDEGIGEKKELL